MNRFFSLLAGAALLAGLLPASGEPVPVPMSTNHTPSAQQASPNRVVSAAAPASPVDSSNNLLILCSALGGAVTLQAGRAALSKFLGVKEAPQETTISGQPVEVKKTPIYASAEALDNHVQNDHEEHKEIRDLFLSELSKVYQRVEDTRKDILKAGAERERALSHQIEKLLEKVGELRGTVAELSKRTK